VNNPTYITIMIMVVYKALTVLKVVTLNVGFACINCTENCVILNIDFGCNSPDYL
jgi:hypothetical protein